MAKFLDENGVKHLLIKLRDFIKENQTPDNQPVMEQKKIR